MNRINPIPSVTYHTSIPVVSGQAGKGEGVISFLGANYLSTFTHKEIPVKTEPVIPPVKTVVRIEKVNIDPKRQMNSNSQNKKKRKTKTGRRINRTG